MLVHCPICSEVLLPSDVLFTTPCGHIFHNSCLERWVSSNTSCPQCRQECSIATIHRVYLPEVNFQDNDSLIERLNEINNQKIECETKLKLQEQTHKAKEMELKRYKREYHRVLQRNMRKKQSTNNIPAHRRNRTAAKREHTQVSSIKSHPQTHSKVNRNASRTLRSKLYFRERNRLRRLNNNNNEPSRPINEEAPSSTLIVDDADSVYAISVSSDD